LTFCASPIQILKRGLKRKLVPTIIDFMPPPGLGDQQLTTRGWLIVAQAAGTSARGQMARSCTSLPDEGPQRLDRLSRSAPIFPSTDGDPQISILVRWGDNWRL
jgi:hypothetical protein